MMSRGQTFAWRQAGIDDMAKPAMNIDLWDVATRPDDGTAPIAIGRTLRDDLPELLGLSRRKWRCGENPLDGRPTAEAEDVCFEFDEEMRLSGMSYGFRHADDLPYPVICAVSGTDINGLALEHAVPICGTAQLMLNGKTLQDFATLPRFCATLPKTTKVELTGRGYDKWLRATIKTPLGVLVAEFLLKSMKVPFAEIFHMDYCLYGLSFLSNAVRGAPRKPNGRPKPPVRNRK